MIYNLGILDNIGDAIVQGLRTLMGSLIATIYEFISTLYQVFIYISKAQIIDNDFIYPIYRKIGFILSLFMIFKLSFALIQSLVDPDKFTDKKSGFGAIIGRSVLAVVLLGITPSIFREAFSLQNLIVGSSNRENVIYKFIVNKSVPGNFNTLGRRLASDLYFSFFTDDEEPKMSGAIINLGAESTKENRFPEENIGRIKSLVEEGNQSEQINSFHDTVPYLATKGENEKYVIEFQWLYLLGFGIACVWFFITYCIQIGIRVIQLGYLQIIAPIPILSYISDPEGAFKKWIKQCTTTYLDLFIRLAIIYFVMTLIGDIIDQFRVSNSIIMESTGLPANGTITGMVKVFIIIGLLMFAKKVPELLKDLFPNMGGGAASLSFGLKGPKKTLEDIPLLGGPANKALGYAESLGKKAGKFAWSHTGGAAGKAIWNRTGGRVKGNYNRWKDNRKNAAEIKEMEKPGEHLFNKYGTEIENAFKNDEYRNSYLNLKNAKDENRAAEKEYEEARESGNAQRLADAIDRKNTAAKALNDAQKTHDNMRKRYGADARREDSFSMYKSMHPDKFLNNSNNNTRNRLNNNMSTTTASSPARQNNQSVFGSISNGSDDGNRLNNNMSTTTASSPARQNNQSVFGSISNGSDDGNPYENGHGQFTADSISESANNDNPYENPNYYNDNGDFRNSSNSNSEDDNPYTNPNYYNDNNQASNNNNDDDEFDGSNYY